MSVQGMPDTGAWKQDAITPELQQELRTLNHIAQERGQSLAQVALAWTLRSQGEGRGDVTSALIGASRPQQILENVQAMEHADFSDEELARIDVVLWGWGPKVVGPWPHNAGAATSNADGARPHKSSGITKSIRRWRAADLCML